MLSKLRAMGRVRGKLDLASTALTGVWIQLLTLFSGPLVARMLGPEGRGELVLVMVVSLQCSFVGAVGLPNAIAHRVASAQVAARDLLEGSIRVWAAWAFVPALAAASLTAVFLHGAQGLAALAGGAFLATLLSVWLLILGGMLRGENDVRRINRFRTIGPAFYVAIVVAVFVAGRTDRTIVILLAFAASQAVGIAFGWARLKKPTRRGVGRVPREEIHRVARRGFLSSTSVLDGLGIDLIVVGLVLGEASLGLYSVALSITNLPVIVATGIASILLPRVAALPDAAGIPVLRRWMLGSVAITVVVVLAMEAVIAPVIRLAFGQEFVPATACARIFAAAWGFLAIRRLLSAAAQAQGNEARASVVEVTGLGLLLAGLLVGMQWSGIEGAALAMLVAGIVTCALLAVVVRWSPLDERSAKA